jgi:hypothetical protein
MESLLVPFDLVDEPTPEHLKDNHNVDREADSMVRICEAPGWANSEPTKNEYDSAQK